MGLLDTLSSINTSATALSNLMLVNPKDTSGIEAQGYSSPVFLFHYEGENTVLMESDVTDHTVEDNTNVNDQVALKPEIVTTHGFIGELNDIVPPALAIARLAIDKLLTISAYLPQVSATALMIYNRAVQEYQVAQLAAAAAVSAWSTLGGSANPITSALGDFSNQNKQQKAFLLFYGYWRSRTLFTVKTPWAKFDDMIIKSWRTVQDETTKVITDFEITFKKMRFAKTIGKSRIISGQGRYIFQSSPLVDNGSTSAVLDQPLMGSASPGKGLLGF